jgi:DNA-binding protein HU-beta
VKALNKTQLRDEVVRRTELPAKQVDDVVDALLSAVTDAVASGDKVTLPGFGTFEPRERSARTGRNPQTGEQMDIPASTAPGFKAGAAFRKAVAGA